jgi:hypothetical protein
MIFHLHKISDRRDDTPKRPCLFFIFDTRDVFHSSPRQFLRHVRGEALKQSLVGGVKNSAALCYNGIFI